MMKGVIILSTCAAIWALLRGAADTADRPGHCATVVGRGATRDKRGGKGRETVKKKEEVGCRNN